MGSRDLLLEFGTPPFLGNKVTEGRNLPHSIRMACRMTMLHVMNAEASQ